MSICNQVTTTSLTYTVSYNHLPSLSFFSHLPRPPRSTLFPYTTLFRSDWRPDRGELRDRLRCQDRRVPDAGARSRQRRDRKSTRLNSSHLGISYAVFCLKKKKKNNKIFIDRYTR